MSTMMECYHQEDMEWVPCDHSWCEDPYNCQEGTWQFKRKDNGCNIVASSPKQDTCLTCGKTYDY